jgi:hypothetical protein
MLITLLVLLGQVFAADWGMCSPLGSIQLTRSGRAIWGRADKAAWWSWLGSFEAEWRLFSKAVANELLELTTAFTKRTKGPYLCGHLFTSQVF